MTSKKNRKNAGVPTLPKGPDLYAELGLARSATIDDIKRAYRRLALQNHPDKCPGDQEAHERFQRISLAYSVLSDEQKRRCYDQTGTTEGLDISPDEFLDMFKSLVLEIIGGADMIRDMLSCFTPRELARLPPFPFPKELFPPGTFPPGLRFSGKGLKGMPFQVEDLIQNGDLHGLFVAMSAAAATAADMDHSQPSSSKRSGRGGGFGFGFPPSFMMTPGAAAAQAAHRKPNPGARRGGRHVGGSGGGWGGTFEDNQTYGDGEEDEHDSDDGSSSDWTDLSEGELEALYEGVEEGGQPSPPASPQEPPTASQARAAASASAAPEAGAGGLRRERRQDSEQPREQPQSASQQQSQSGGRKRSSSSGSGSQPQPCHQSSKPEQQQSRPRSSSTASSRSSSSNSSSLSSSSRAAATPGPTAGTGAGSGSATGPRASPASPSAAAAAGGLPAALVRDWLLAARGCDVAALAVLLAREPGLLGSRGAGMGHTALHWCAAKGGVEAVEWLLEQGLGINVRNDDGATPLHAAARNGRFEAVEALLAWGRRPPPSGQGPAASPPLASPGAATGAASAQQQAAPAAAAVCDVLALDGEGRTALQLALEFGHTQVAVLLRKAAEAAEAGAMMAAVGGCEVPARACASQPPVRAGGGKAADGVGVAAFGKAPVAAEAVAAVSDAAVQRPLERADGGGFVAETEADAGLVELSREEAAVEVEASNGAKAVLVAPVEVVGLARAGAVAEGSEAEVVPTKAGGGGAEVLEPADAAQAADASELAGGAAAVAVAGAGAHVGVAAATMASVQSTGDEGRVLAAAQAAGSEPARAPEGPSPQVAETATAPLAAEGAAQPPCSSGGAATTTDRVYPPDAAIAAVAARVAGGEPAPAPEDSAAGPAERHEEVCGSAVAADASLSPSAPPPPPPPPQAPSPPPPPPPPVSSRGQEAGTPSEAAAPAASSGPAGHQGTGRRLGGLTPEEKAARRAALLAADEAAEREAERREAEKAAAAEAAAAAAGLRSREEGRAWLEAARQGDLAAMQRMLVANPRLLGYQGQGTNFAFTSHTALHWAAAKGHSAVARWLLQQGADPDAPNASGATPLHAAASQGADQCARLLVVEAAAKMGVTDVMGETARDILLRRETEGGGGSGGSGTRLAAELDVLARVVALRDAPGGEAEWTARAMRSALVAAGVNVAGLLERQELVEACRQLVAKQPPRILPARKTTQSVSPVPGPGPGPARATGGTSGGGAGGSGSSSGAGAAAAAAAAAGAAEAASGSSSDEPDAAGGDGGGAAAATAAAAAAAAADSARQRGNEAFSRGDYPKAVSHYTMALRLTVSPSAVLYSNRSAAYCGMSYFGKAQADAEEAIRLDPGQPKYRCRLGAALLGQRQWREAEEAFRAALAIDPTYAAAVQGLADVRAGVAQSG